MSSGSDRTTILTIELQLHTFDRYLLIYAYMLPNKSIAVAAFLENCKVASLVEINKEKWARHESNN